MQALRVTLVSHSAERGGAETAAARLADALDPMVVSLEFVLLAEGAWAEELRASHPVRIVDGGAVTTVSRVEAARWRRVPSHVSGTARTARALARHARAARSELLVANSLKAAAVVAMAAPLAGVPWVWHLHDRLTADYLPPAVALAARAVARALPKAVVVNSRATADTLRWMPRGKVGIAFPGVPDEWFATSRPEPHGPVVMLGRVGATKGQLLFADAAQRLRATHQDVRFVVVGDALFHDAEYMRALERHPAVVGGTVRLDGWSADPARTVRGARLLVHASPVPEPFGQVVVEAMAAGVPVIATRAGGAAEVLDPHGDAAPLADGVWQARHGLAVRPGDPKALATAIGYSLTHPRESETVAAAARAYAWSHYRIGATALVVQDVWSRSARRSDPSR